MRLVHPTLSLLLCLWMGMTVSVMANEDPPVPPPPVVPITEPVPEQALTGTIPQEPPVRRGEANSSDSAGTLDVQLKAAGHGAADEGADLVLRTPDGVEHMRITSAGKVGIGTATPLTKLHVNDVLTAGAAGTDRLTDRLKVNGATQMEGRLFVQNGADNSQGLFVTHQPSFAVGDPTQTDYGLFVQTTEQVASGASNPATLLGTYSKSYLNGAGTLGSVTAGWLDAGTAVSGGTLHNGFGLRINFTRAAGSTITSGYGIHINDVLATNDWGIYQAGADDTNYFAGDMQIGATGAVGSRLVVNGDANFSGTVTGGNIQAKYQDLAEWVPSRHNLVPGTVVVLDTDIGNGVMASSGAYDLTVAGVVSLQPGIILGEAGASKEQIATTGRVRVLVDATTAPIRAGDLVTSAIPGRAMRSEAVQLNGRPFHQPGTIIGKALEPLASGEGEILVLLSLQ